MLSSSCNYLKYIFLTVLFCAGCSEQPNYLPGYIEGEYTYVASGVSGTLFDLSVQRGQMVTAKDLLYQLDPEPEQASVDVAKTNIADLQAQVDFYKIELERQQTLFAQKAVAKEALDQAQEQYNSKAQQLAGYKADLVHMQWSLDQKFMHAPVNGQVFDTFFRVGEKVGINQPVLAILAPENIRALFYLPQDKLSQLKLGQTIKFDCDGCPAKTQAKVIYISPEAEFAPPIIYSKDTRNKLVFLVRAEIPKDIVQKFHPGQPIDVYISHE